MTETSRAHWENIYSTKEINQVSWFQAKPEMSLSLVRTWKPATQRPAVIDVGGGASTLVDCLLAEGYESLTVLDIAEAALDKARQRLGTAAQQIKWLVSDITAAVLPAETFDLWHDRAVFHFLTEEKQQASYVATLQRALKRGGVVVMSAFAPDGPTKCSNLNVRQYDCDALALILGDSFQLIASTRELHQTPFQTQQAFSYCVFQKT